MESAQPKDHQTRMKELRAKLERESEERQRDLVARLNMTPERKERARIEGLRLLDEWRKEDAVKDPIHIGVNPADTVKDVTDVQSTVETNQIILGRKVSVQLAHKPEPVQPADTTAASFQSAKQQVSAVVYESDLNLDEHNDEDKRGQATQVTNKVTDSVADLGANIAPSMELGSPDQSALRTRVAGRCVAANFVPPSTVLDDNQDDRVRVNSPRKLPADIARVQSSQNQQVELTIRPNATPSRSTQNSYVSSPEGSDTSESELRRVWNVRKRRELPSPRSDGSPQNDLVGRLKRQSMSTSEYPLPRSPQSSPHQLYQDSTPRIPESGSVLSARTKPKGADSHKHRARGDGQHIDSRPPADSAKRPPEPFLSSASRPEKMPKTTSQSVRQCGSHAEVTPEPPTWYKTLEPPKTRKEQDRNADSQLAVLRAAIDKLSVRSNRSEEEVISIQNKLHRITFERVNPGLLKRYRLLHNDVGLPRLFLSQSKTGTAWPWHIKADAKELYDKWCSEVFETEILRGIKSVKKSTSRTAFAIDFEWKARYGLPSGNKPGPNGLTNGQWWPLQIAALRDGAHGATQAGISCDSDDAACSCILSSGHGYDDVDYGDKVLYNGTDRNDSDPEGEPTKATNALIKRWKDGVPIRLIRSHNLKSKWAPEKGFRYDGLYFVKDIETTPPKSDKRQRYRFLLKRCPEQDPIRGYKSGANRPTAEEIIAFNKDKTLRGGKA